MPFAIMQNDDTHATVEQLKAAFTSIDRLAGPDAHYLARHAFGYLTDNLTFEEAMTLQAALARQGVEATVVDQADLFALPPAKKTKRIDCLPDKLVMYDALGRPIEHDWQRVLVVAAGMVRGVEFERPEPAEADKAFRDIKMSSLTFLGRRFHRSYGRYDNDADSVEHEVTRPLLNLILDAEPSRYQADGDEMLYHYLGDRQSRHAWENFVTVVQDLLGSAALAVTNQGAVSLASQSQTVLVYPDKRSFEREIIWLVWRGTQQTS